MYARCEGLVNVIVSCCLMHYFTSLLFSMFIHILLRVSCVLIFIDQLNNVDISCKVIIVGEIIFYRNEMKFLCLK